MNTYEGFADLETSRLNLNGTIQEFMVNQKDYKKNLWIILEKMGFYSAGIISLSTTFIGFIISVDKSVIAQELAFQIPISLLLFASWFIFAACLVLAFAYKWFDNYYMYYSSKFNLVKNHRDYDKEQLKLIKADSNIDFAENITHEIYSNDLTKKIKQLEEIITNTDKKQKEHLKISTILQYIIPILFILGIILLLFFISLSISFLIKT
jgi:hypothetical protein